MIRTKIICTMGPSCHSLDKILELIRAGMNVARLNFSHGTHAEHLAIIENLKEARHRLGVPLSIMLDTKGPEIRLGKIKEGQTALHPGQKWHLRACEVIGDEHQASINPPTVLESVVEGTRILFDDGYISSTVVEILDDGVIVEIFNGGSIRSQVIKQLQLHAGSAVNIEVEDGKIIIETPKYDLDTMLKEITPRNMHHLMLDDEQQLGNEAW